MTQNLINGAKLNKRAERLTRGHIFIMMAIVEKSIVCKNRTNVREDYMDLENRQIPIIVVHKGKQKYLKNCIDCAKEHGNTVILIGDDQNQGMCDAWISYKECESELFEEFRKNYIHMSSNSVFFELICFERYFYVYQYMVKHELDECVMIDSDALVFGKVTSALIPEGTEMASSWFEEQREYRWAVCPHFTYWTRRGIRDFLQFCIDSYKEEDKRKLLIEKYEFHQRTQSPGGICDMTLLYLWMKQTDFKVENFSLRKGTVIDYNINEPNIDTVSYVMWDRYGMKRILFEDGIPHFVQQEDGKRVPVLVIHAWGGSKKYMGILKDKKEGSFYYDWARGTAWIAKRAQKLIGIFHKK